MKWQLSVGYESNIINTIVKRNVILFVHHYHGLVKVFQFSPSVVSDSL